MAESTAAGGKRIFRAARAGDIEAVRAILREDPDLLAVCESDGSTLLHCAAWKGHLDLVAALIEAGADVDAQSNNSHYGGTPLHAAAHGNQRQIAEKLIQAGADVNAVSCNGRTPLEETNIHNASAVAKLLR